MTACETRWYEMATGPPPTYFFQRVIYESTASSNPTPTHNTHTPTTHPQHPLRVYCDDICVQIPAAYSDKVLSMPGCTLAGKSGRNPCEILTGTCQLRNLRAAKIVPRNLLARLAWKGVTGAQHIEAETKWPLCSRQHFQMHVLEWNCVNLA